MAHTVEEPSSSEPGQASLALVYDRWLDGEHFTEKERELADAFAVCGPYIPWLMRAQRRMLGRVVRYALAQGVRQFLDLGSGLPTKRHVHQVAEKAGAEARVVYVDNDPRVAELAPELLAGADNAAFLEADLLRPEDVLHSPEVRNLLRLDEPVALLMIETLAQLSDDQCPADVVAAYVDALCPGSYVALAHSCENEQLRAVFEMFDRMKLADRPQVYLRSPVELEDFFTGLELVEPGVVPIPLWQPRAGEEADRNPEQVHMYVGVARKP